MLYIGESCTIAHDQLQEMNDNGTALLQIWHNE